MRQCNGAFNLILRHSKRHTPASREAGVDQDRGGSVGLSADLDEARVAETVVLLHVVAGRHNVDVAHAVARAEAPAAVAPAVMAKAPTVEAPRRSGGRSECGGAECCDAGERENGLADHDVLLGLMDFVSASVVGRWNELVHDTMCRADLNGC